jgi:hypothetical protein
MKTRYRIPHVAAVEVPRAYVIRVTFDDGLVRELEFVRGVNANTVFEPFEDSEFFAKAAMDSVSGTVTWPNGVDVDAAVLHGDFEPAGQAHFRDVTPT